MITNNISKFIKEIQESSKNKTEFLLPMHQSGFFIENNDNDKFFLIRTISSLLIKKYINFGSNNKTVPCCIPLFSKYDLVSCKLINNAYEYLEDFEKELLTEATQPISNFSLNFFKKYENLRSYSIVIIKMKLFEIAKK